MFRPLNPYLMFANILGGCALGPLLVHVVLTPATWGQRSAVAFLAVAFVLAAYGGWQEHMAARRLTFEAWKKTLPTVELTEEEAERLGFRKKKDDA